MSTNSLVVVWGARMRSARLGGIAGAAAIIGLVVAGCSGDEGGSTSSLDWDDSPLAEYYNALGAGADDSEFDTQMREQEELVAACMAKEGFEYTPVDYSDNSGFVDLGDQDYETKEYAETQGYGIATGMNSEDPPFGESEFDDPNSTYTESLSEAELNAYYEALEGPMPADDAELEEWEPTGCYAQASDEVFGASGQDEDPRIAAIDEKISALYEEVESHDTVREIEADWAECMADSGHPDLAGKYAAYETIYDKTDALWDPQTGEIDAGQLEEVKQAEIELAVADWECADEINYEQRFMQFWFDLEQQFVDENKADLDAIIAEYSQK